MNKVTDEKVRIAGDTLMQHGLNAPEQAIYQASRAALESALASAPVTVPDDAAKIIYDAMAWASALPGKPGEPIPSWESGENSFAQDRARQSADRILSAIEPQEGWRSRATDDVLAERKRQVDAEGWTLAHDDQHDNGEMAAAAVCYAFTAVRSPHEIQNRIWPWASDWWRPSDSRRNLVKAGALILAEIERLDRLSTPPAGRSEG